MTLSRLATTSIEEVATAAGAPLWFQLYVFRDRELTRSLVQRAEAAGYVALVLTVDAPVLGRRERDARNRFVLPDGLFAENLVSAALLIDGGVRRGTDILKALARGADGVLVGRPLL